MLVIRPWKKSDIDAVYEIEVECFRSPWTKLSLLSEYRNKIAVYKVVELDNRIVGYCGMWVLYDEAHITNIAISRNYRGNGYAQKLLIEMMKSASLKDATMMTLEVRETNIPAQNLYKKLSFEKEGERKKYYQDTGESAYLLWNRNIQETILKFDEMKE